SSRAVRATAMLMTLLGTCRPGIAAHAQTSDATGFHVAAEGSFSERRNAHGGWDGTSIQPAFRVVPAVVDGKLVDLLLVEHLETTSHSDAERVESRLTVSGYVADKARYDRLLWKLTDDADEGRPDRSFVSTSLYEAIRHGCCGAEEVHDFYSLRTGVLEGTGTSSPPAAAVLGIPSVTSRLIAYQSTNAQRPPDAPGVAGNLLGVLTLGSETGVRHRVAV